MSRLRISDPQQGPANGSPAAHLRPTARSSYARAKRQPGLDAVIAAAMLSAEQLADNVEAGTKVHVPVDPSKAPRQLLPEHADMQVGQ